MYYVYVLLSEKDERFYTGFTDDLHRRIEEHNRGDGVSTKSRIPFKLIYYEWCITKEDAVIREKNLKSGRGKRYLRSRLKCYLEREGKGMADFE